MKTTDIIRATNLPEFQAKAFAALVNKGPVTVTEATDSMIRRTFATLAAKGFARIEYGVGARRTYTAVVERVEQTQQTIDGRAM